MKKLVNIAAAALISATALSAPAFAGSDNEDYNTAKGLCRAAISKAMGASGEQLRDGGLTLRAGVVKLGFKAPINGKSQSVGCTMNRKTQELALKWPEGYQPTVAAAPAETTAAPVAQ